MQNMMGVLTRPVQPSHHKQCSLPEPSQCQQMQVLVTGYRFQGSAVVNGVLLHWSQAVLQHGSRPCTYAALVTSACFSLAHAVLQVTGVPFQHTAAL